jgi:DNA polymerase III epsilon subunit family exonuclease
LSVHGGVPLEALGTTGFVAIDLETTGLDPRRDVIVAAAAIPFVHGEPQPGYVTLVNPGRPIPEEATRIHGVTDDMVADAPAVADVLVKLHNFCGGRVVVGHDVGFDLAVIARQARACGVPRPAGAALDTGRLAAALHPEWPDFSLDAVAERVGIEIRGRHTADGDAIAAGWLLLRLVPQFAARGLRTVRELSWAQRARRRL